MRPRSCESAIALLGQRYDVPVLAADTVVDRDGAALGKPRDAAEAARMLELLSGREHLVHTAFALGIPGRTPHVESAHHASLVLSAGAAARLRNTSPPASRWIKPVPMASKVAPRRWSSGSTAISIPSWACR